MSGHCVSNWASLFKQLLKILIFSIHLSGISVVFYFELILKLLLIKDSKPLAFISSILTMQAPYCRRTVPSKCINSKGGGGGGGGGLY